MVTAWAAGDLICAINGGGSVGVVGAVGAIADLHVDLWVVFPLFLLTAELTAVAQEIERQAEPQYAQHQQAHVHLRRTNRKKFQKA